MKIGVVGLGFVGLTLSVALASREYKVYGVDIDIDKVELVRSGRSPFYEEGLEDMLKKVINKKLFVSNNYDYLRDADLVFICVGTPPRPDGSQDQRYLIDAIKRLASVWRNSYEFKTIVVKSTVIPGTTRKLAQLFSRISELKLGEDFGIVFNPEFLREGKALHDTFHPYRVVIGCIDRRSCRIVEELWREFYKKNERIPPILIMSSEEAELVKYASNSFLALRISYANTIANICEETENCNVIKVLEAVGLDPRIGNQYLRPGLGYGGSCLPKDVKALIRYSEEIGVKPYLFEAVDKVNEEQPLKAIKYLLNTYGDLKGREITVLGLSFKPGTSDIRESVALKVIDKLLKLGAYVKVHDPMALDNVRKIYGNKIKYYTDPIDALKNSDGVIIATEWNIYQQLKPEDFKIYMRNPVVVDGRRIYDPEEFIKAGIIFYAIGYSRKRANQAS